jgi:hypothetical protein
LPQRYKYFVKSKLFYKKKSENLTGVSALSYVKRVFIYCFQSFCGYFLLNSKPRRMPS